MLKPKSEALAFRIWAYCEPLGWNCTVGEVADELGVSLQLTVAICKMKGWSTRLRSSIVADSHLYGRGRPLLASGDLFLREGMARNRMLAPSFAEKSLSDG